MKKVFLFITLSFFLFSCKFTYIEIYNIERYPMEREDVYVSGPNHWHYCDKNNNWNCLELDVDTFRCVINDTIDVPIHQGTFKVKNYKNINSQKKDGKGKCH